MVAVQELTRVEALKKLDEFDPLSLISPSEQEFSELVMCLQIVWPNLLDQSQYPYPHVVKETSENKDADDMEDSESMKYWQEIYLTACYNLRKFSGDMFHLYGNSHP